MKRNYKELLEAGNRAQLEKLYENKHKDGWDDISVGYAISRLKEELRELALAYHTESTKHVRREAADIANFAYMIILKCDKYITPPTDQPVKDVCEWVKADDGGIDTNCECTFGIVGHNIVLMDNPYCPHCGRPVKIVEEEK